MKTKTILALLLLSCGSAGANHPVFRSTVSISGGEEITLHGSYPSAGYRVIRGIESFTLSDFLISGRFCEWRGKHEWIPYDPCEWRKINPTLMVFIPGCDSEPRKIN